MKSKDMVIVLIEDNIDDAELTIIALKKGKLLNKIVHLKDGAMALDYFFPENPANAPDYDNVPMIVLLDLKMPKVDGIEVLTRLKSDERTRPIPVIVLTSSKEDPDVKNCYSLGANSYIVKPVGFENFSNSITDLGVYWVLLNYL